MHTRAALVASLVLGLSAAAAVAQVPDLSPWNGTWLKTKVKQKGVEFHAAGPGTEKDRFAGTVYVHLGFDPGIPDRLSFDVWVREDQWELLSLTVLHVAGMAEDALFVFNQIPVTPAPFVDASMHLGFAIRLTGKRDGAAIAKGSLKTLGGYFVEFDDVPGSDLRAAGSLALSGKTTTKLPDDLPLE